MLGTTYTPQGETPRDLLSPIIADDSPQGETPRGPLESGRPFTYPHVEFYIRMSVYLSVADGQIILGINYLI